MINAAAPAAAAGAERLGAPRRSARWPSSETRTRKAIDDAFTEAEAEDEDDRPGTQGISVPAAKPMCPQCALAA
ncbi:hypothetical protein ABZZ80_15690 [Streptomyces sp. NPDC006356]